MLNRNPSDNQGATVDEAQDERGRRLLQKARGLRGLGHDQVRRIASRLQAEGAPARRRRLVPIVATLAVLLSAGTAFGWATGTLQRLPLVGALFTLHSAGSRAGTRPAPGSLRVAPPAEQPTVAGSDDVAASRAAHMAAPPARRRGVFGHPALGPQPQPQPQPDDERDRIASSSSPIPAAVPRTGTPVAPDNPIVREGESFATVLRGWRRDHDGQAALAALDLHDRTFPGGQMALESRLLRVEILLAEHRDRDALAILDGLPLGKVNLPRGRELLTVRGELRVRAGRCDDGRADLAAVLGGSDILAERARNAITHCP